MREGRKVLEKVPGMTPARFDLLYAIRRWNITDGDPAAPRALAMRQDVLCRTLGLHRSTVSESLAQLEEWQWIRRQRAETDRRTKDVFLTALGLSLIWRAMKIVFRQRVCLSFYERIFPSTPATHVVERIGTVIAQILTVAGYLGDRATLQYEFGWPTDDYPD